MTNLICVYLPVLVESPAAFLAQMLGEDGLEGPETTWSLDVANTANNHHWRCLNNGHSLHDFLLVGFCQII